MAQTKLSIGSPAKAGAADEVAEETAPGKAASGANASEAAAAGQQSWQNLLDLDSQVFEQKGIRLLTPEARVLIHLKLNGTMTVSTAMEKAGVSYRGFYTVLERLKQAGLVGQVKDKEDQRVRQLRLDPSMPIPPDRF
ncbi:MAG: MarR family winged helix-turn-helix transcriptional regulator [Sphingomonadaceae bacterium]